MALLSAYFLLGCGVKLCINIGEENTAVTSFGAESFVFQFSIKKFKD
jgi:hypothetical protein